MASIPLDASSINEAGNLTPQIFISRSLQTVVVLSIPPGVWITTGSSRKETENLLRVANPHERNESVAPESNKIVAVMLLIGNIPIKTSGASRASSAEIWLTRAWRYWVCPPMLLTCGFGLPILLGHCLAKCPDFPLLKHVPFFMQSSLTWLLMKGFPWTAGLLVVALPLFQGAWCRLGWVEEQSAPHAASVRRVHTGSSLLHTFVCGRH